ncbi:MAG: hypothetical protein LH461_08850, partial [Spirochaetaceae bacterium]|nr:hypothetical protein [Spirochaetaceae bacterium]
STSFGRPWICSPGMGAPTGTLQRLCLVVSLSLGLLGLVGGCSDPDQPSTLPRETPTVTRVPSSPTPATPEAQVEATIHAYFAATNSAFRTGDVTAVRVFSTDGCPCRQAADDIEEVLEAGGRFEGLRYEVQRIRVHDVEPDSAVAEVIATVPAYKVYDGKGDVTENSQGGRLHTDFSMIRSGNRWIIGNSINLS